MGVGLVILLALPSGEKNLSPQTLSSDRKLYKEIVNPSGFVNTDGLTIKELVGKKVILVDFLTYSCINCQRTFPYINAWYDKYKDRGLEIIGIHTPEFAFERDINNVREAMKRFAITHPIVLDNDYATWNAYGNRYWPRKYLIDINGNIVYDHIGEGGYEETEMKIRALLEERAHVLGENVSKSSDSSLVASTIPEMNISTQSPETYFGSDRNEYLGNGLVGQAGEQNYTLPTTFKFSTLYLGGIWNIGSENATSIKDSKVIYRYNAQDVYLVASADSLVGIEVWQDGKLVTDSAGDDVDKHSMVTIKESRLYKLIHNKELGEHLLELRIKGTGALFYAFTFG